MRADPKTPMADEDDGVTLVTVVHEGDLPLLELQARSVALHAKKAGLSAINILVNDVNEARIMERVRAMIPLYGSLSHLVQVYGGADVFVPRAGRRIARSWLYRFFARYPRLQLIRRGGWQGNDGWRVQQAFKLASVRVARSRYTLVLDAKNVLVADVVRDDFVAPDGRARARIEVPGPDIRKWLSQSLVALGHEHAILPSGVVSYVTPFCAENAFLKAVLDSTEERNGPVQAFFAFRLNNATEFMLISAWCHLKAGGVATVFADGLPRPYTLWGGKELMGTILREVVDEEGKFLGLHPGAFRQMDEAHRDVAARLLVDRGIIASRLEFDELAAHFNGMAANG